MSTTVKRISVSLTKENLHQLQILMQFFGETQVEVLKRGLDLLYAKCSERKDFIKFLEEEVT